MKSCYLIRRNGMNIRKADVIGLVIVKNSENDIIYEDASCVRAGWNTIYKAVIEE